MVCVIECVSARGGTAVAKAPGRALITREQLFSTTPSSVPSASTVGFGIAVAALGLIVVHIGIKAVVMVTVPTPAQFPIIESTSLIVPIAQITAASSVRNLLSQALAGVVFGVHKVETTLLMGTRLLPICLDGGSYLQDGVGMS
jgi:hypothetical protein